MPCPERAATAAFFAVIVLRSAAASVVRLMRLMLDPVPSAAPSPATETMPTSAPLFVASSARTATSAPAAFAVASVSRAEVVPPMTFVLTVPLTAAPVPATPPLTRKEFAVCVAEAETATPRYVFSSRPAERPSSPVSVPSVRGAL